MLTNHFTQSYETASIKMDETVQLLWGVLFGGIGFGFFLYGKKQRQVIPFLTGLSLIALPYIIPNVILLVAAGVMLVALPYFVKI